VPLVTVVARERQRSSVVFPAPDFPMTATNSPGAIRAETSARAGAVLPGKLRPTASRVTAGDRSLAISVVTVRASRFGFVTRT